MKKLTTLLAATLLTAAPLLTTSCDDDPWYGPDDPWWGDYDDGDWSWDNDYYDDRHRGNGGGDLTAVDEAQVLNGEWEGTMTLTQGDDGRAYSFNANMTFTQNNVNATKGTGTEYDYVTDDRGHVTDHQVLKFDWYIDEQRGDIYVRYLDGGSTYVMDASAREHGFYLSEREGIFQGYMVGTNNSNMIRFDFRRVTSQAKGTPASHKVARDFTIGSNYIEKVGEGMRRIAPKR